MATWAKRYHEVTTSEPPSSTPVTNSRHELPSSTPVTNSRNQRLSRAAWQAKNSAAEVAKIKAGLPNMIDDLQSEIECKLTLQGATAIEDKLQALALYGNRLPDMATPSLYGTTFLIWQHLPFLATGRRARDPAGPAHRRNQDLDAHGRQGKTALMNF